MSTTETPSIRLAERILTGFDQHYQIFRSYCQRAHQGFLNASGWNFKLFTGIGSTCTMPRSIYASSRCANLTVA